MFIVDIAYNYYFPMNEDYLGDGLKNQFSDFFYPIYKKSQY